MKEVVDPATFFFPASPAEWRMRVESRELRISPKRRERCRVPLAVCDFVVFC
jgi:hypothetical protein